MHSGGKARIPNAVASLRAASVPTVSIVDFDILRSDGDLINLVRAHGGDISENLSDLNVPASRMGAKTKIDEIFARKQGDDITSGDREQVSKGLSGVDGWRDAKLHGSRLLVGDALNAFNRINARMRSIGVFIVPEGELEMFHRAIPTGDKEAWLASVLESKHYAEDAEAHLLIEEVSRQLSSMLASPADGPSSSQISG